MHTVPLKKSLPNEVSLLGLVAKEYPEVLQVQGKNPWEGGALHRLDYDTEGLVLFARTQRFYNHMIEEQEAGRFIKYYKALVPNKPGETLPASISSGFRPYGKGRKTVRPVFQAEETEKKNTTQREATTQRQYTTYIEEINQKGEELELTIKLDKGFRHQIRCHLAYLGFPIIGDQVYGGGNAGGSLSSKLQLRATRLVFA
jgi:23S rRNA pseudouridine1911/1915/1917 synthase